jgi:hypothetical protein
VSANPTAATLENDFVGQRSGVRPFRGLVVCQKKSNVRRASVSTNALSAGDALYDIGRETGPFDAAGGK